MAKGKPRKPKRDIIIVQPARDGDGWEIRWAEAKRASDKARTQRAAEKRARELRDRYGGREMQTRDKKGRIVDSDTAPGAHDPFPPRDKNR